MRRTSQATLLLTCSGVLFSCIGISLLALIVLALPVRTVADDAVTVQPVEQTAAPVVEQPSTEPVAQGEPFTPNGEEFAIRTEKQTFDTPEELLQVLLNYNNGSSSAAHIDVARSWFEDCQKLQVDCGIIVAKFIWESGAGTNSQWVGFMPGGGISHNVGNIICAGYSACYADSSGCEWRRYPNWQEGGRDAIKLLYVYATEGCPARPEGPIPTARKAIQCWAPSGDGDNSPSTYADFVERVIRKWRQDDFSF